MALTEEGIIKVPGLLSRWVRLRGGARAHYVTSGEDGPAVVLIHGGAEGSSGTALWADMAVFLAKNGFRVYAPDRPGFGLSDTRPEYWPRRGVMSWVEFMEDFADALCLDEFYLAGNSQGAVCVAYYVVNYPWRVRAFVLVSTGGLFGPLGIKPSQLRPSTLSLPSFNGSEASMRHHLLEVAYRKEAIDDDIVKMRTLSATKQMESFAVGTEAARTFAGNPSLAQLLDLRSRLSASRIPAVYLYGKEDVRSPVENAYLQEDALPNIQFFYPDKAGHLGQIDRPEVYKRIFLEFFRDGKVSRQAAELAGVSTRRPEIAELVEQRKMAV